MEENLRARLNKIKEDLEAMSSFLDEVLPKWKEANKRSIQLFKTVMGIKPRLKKATHQFDVLMKNSKRMELFKQGLSDREIAEKVGVKTTTITQWRRHRGLRKRK